MRGVYQVLESDLDQRSRPLSAHGHTAPRKFVLHFEAKLPAHSKATNRRHNVKIGYVPLLAPAWLAQDTKYSVAGMIWLISALVLSTSLNASRCRHRLRQGDQHHGTPPLERRPWSGGTGSFGIGHHLETGTRVRVRHTS